MTEELKGGVAVIEKDGRHFLLKQSFNKPFGGQWRHPGGYFEKGEGHAGAILRETQEETGFDIEVIDKKPFHSEKIDYAEGYFGFYRALLKGGILKLQKCEAEDCGWFTLEEIKKLDLMRATKSFYEKKYNL